MGKSECLHRVFDYGFILTALLLVRAALFSWGSIASIALFRGSDIIVRVIIPAVIVGCIAGVIGLHLSCAWIIISTAFWGGGYMRGLLIVPRRVRDSGWPAGDGSRHQVSTEDDGDIPEKRGAWADNALPVAAADGAASTSTASGRRAGAAATDGVKRGTVRRTAGRGTACGAGWYAVMFCSQCGNKIGADAAFCPKCGNRVR